MKPIDEAARAERAWSKILRKPSQVLFERAGVITDDAPMTGPTTLPAQTVRVVKESRPREVRGEAGEGIQLQCVVYGIRNHATLPDTDMERGDTFELDGDHYVCDYVNLVPGGKQGHFILQGIGT